MVFIKPQVWHIHRAFPGLVHIGDGKTHSESKTTIAIKPELLAKIAYEYGPSAKINWRGDEYELMDYEHHKARYLTE
jgi:hypothetical protein